MDKLVLILTICFVSCKLGTNKEQEKSQDTFNSDSVNNSPIICTISSNKNDSLLRIINTMPQKSLPLGIKEAYYHQFEKIGSNIQDPQFIEHNSAEYYFEKMHKELLQEESFKIKDTPCYFALLTNTGKKLHYYPQDFSLITIDKNGNSIDSLTLFKAHYNADAIGKRFYYIDNKAIINVKDFKIYRQAEEYFYLGERSYQIREDGKIVRYFSEDGEFELIDSSANPNGSDGILHFEKGTVFNHSKTATWEEFSTPIQDTTIGNKPNYQYGAEGQAVTLYGIGNYSVGVKTGTWNYYEIVLDLSEEIGIGYRMTTQRNSKAMVREEYNDGKLVRQEIFNRP